MVNISMMSKLSQEYFEVLFQSSPDAIAIMNNEEKVIEINKQFSILFKYSPKESIGVHINDLIVPDILGVEIPTLKDIRNFTCIDTIRKTKKGECIYVSVKAEPIVISKHLIVYYAIYRDISQRILAQKKNQKHLSIIENLLKFEDIEDLKSDELLKSGLKDAVKQLDSEIGFLYRYKPNNKKVEYLTSYGIGTNKNIQEEKKNLKIDAIGFKGECAVTKQVIKINNFNTVIDRDLSLPVNQEILRNYLALPILYRNEVVLIVAVANKDSDFDDLDIGHLRLFYDRLWRIVERKKNMKELSQTMLKAQESDRLKSSFLSNISHEIRTPLNAILGFSNLLSMPGITDIEKESFISQINNGGNELLRIIENIIEISKLEAEKVKLQIIPIIFSKYLIKINNLIQNNKILKENKDLKFSIISNPDLKKITFEVDEEKLTIVLLNIIENSLKFTKKGRIELEYMICRNKVDMLKFSIKDTGIGIPTKTQKIVFDSFRQANENHTKEYGGVGLGLTIAKKIIQIMNGKIWIESKLGIGSVFSFKIPVRICNNNLPDSQGIIINKYNKGKTILIVEDDPTNQIFLDKVLQKSGYLTVTAKDGAEAIDIFYQNDSIDVSPLASRSLLSIKYYLF